MASVPARSFCSYADICLRRWGCCPESHSPAPLLSCAQLSKLTAIVVVQTPVLSVSSWAALAGPGGSRFAVDASSWVWSYLNASAAEAASQAPAPVVACGRGLCDRLAAAMAPNAVPYANFSQALRAVTRGALPALVVDATTVLLALDGAGCVGGVQLVQISGEQTFFTTAAVNASALPGASFLALFNAAIIALQASGVVTNTIAASSAASSCPSLSGAGDTDERASPLTLPSVLPLFWLFLGLVGAGWAVLACEAAVFARRNRGGAATFCSNVLGWYGDAWHRKKALKAKTAHAAAAAAAAATAAAGASGTSAASGGGGGFGGGEPHLAGVFAFGSAPQAAGADRSDVLRAATGMDSERSIGSAAPTLQSPRAGAGDGDGAGSLALSSSSQSPAPSSPQLTLASVDVHSVVPFESAITLSASPVTPTLAQLASRRADDGGDGSSSDDGSSDDGSSDGSDDAGDGDKIAGGRVRRRGRDRDDDTLDAWTGGQ